MPKMKDNRWAPLVGLVWLLTLSSPVWAMDAGLDVQPKMVIISAFFSGVKMHINCDLPRGSQAVLRIRGKRIEEELMRKSHHWDLWMNSGEVDIYQAPTLYIALSSNPDLLSNASDDVPWGYDALERQVRFEGQLKPSERDTIFKEFVQLKERDNLYRLYPGGLKITQTDSGQWRARAGFHLPSRIKPGIYHVALWVIQGGKVTERRDGSFQVLRQGLPEFLNSLARNQGALYGFLAVSLAMVIGMLAGLAFHRRDGGH